MRFCLRVSDLSADGSTCIIANGFKQDIELRRHASILVGLVDRMKPNRDETERLQKLQSVGHGCRPIVYFDSRDF
jgi:hypothetical protein